METPFDPDSGFNDQFPPPGWEEMDADEKHECAQAHLARLRQRREELLQQGPDAAYFVEEIDRQIGPFEQAVNEVQQMKDNRDEAQEAFLQSTATLADSTAQGFVELNPLVEWMALQFPDDPRIQQVKAAFDKLAQQVPKDQVPPQRTLEELEAELRKQGFMQPPPPEPPPAPPPATA